MGLPIGFSLRDFSNVKIARSNPVGMPTGLHDMEVK